MRIAEIIDGLERAPRQGADVDKPEGTRFVVISETALERILRRLRLAEREDAEYFARGGYQPRGSEKPGHPPHGGSGMPGA
jgi:hypothetical protein